MPGYSVTDRSVSPPRLEIPREYNAAVDFIDRHPGEGRADKIAFRDDRATLTYGDLALAVNRAGNALRGLGLRMEERVLLLLTDTISFPVVFFGAIKMGAVPVPVSTLLSSSDYDEILRDSRARVLVVSGSVYDRIAPALARQPFLERVIVDGDPKDGALALGSLLAGAEETLDAAPTTADDACFWLYTSGSTGKLKAAVHAQSDMAYTAEYYGTSVLGIREDDVVFSAAKLFFAYGLGNAMSFPLRVGATAVLMAERPTPEAVIRRLVEHRPTIFYGVPTLYASLLAAPDLPTGGALRVCTSAGEALPADLGERFRARTGVDILDGIGSTEMLHIFVSNRPGEVRYGTTGKPVPGYEVRLLDEAGKPVPQGEIGDLWVSGPSSATSYWNRRALSQRTFEGRWTKTGDHYLMTEDGHYVYQGRSDDTFKVSGLYVSPFEVEAALVSHPAVLEAAVVADKDEHGLVKPRAFVVLRAPDERAEGLADGLKAHVKARLAPHKYPRWIDFVDALPKTATGKIQRFKLRRG
ncbi:benzoate-CoA ligase family protein [Polyangium aurulentum]|uniref:benzoate-CoA ligase family protein n=1 Tax=Polyangium aurulentum TaxID=2567896 RepID=UPI0010AE0DF5|nr:benzoate-CoA ligase family protein [Polyangium aurulentum]UQA58336.1 benzoate-CoA ligase family protein [Polyangium aurulentum]